MQVIILSVPTLPNNRDHGQNLPLIFEDTMIKIFSSNKDNYIANRLGIPTMLAVYLFPWQIKQVKLFHGSIPIMSSPL